jgi:hypothetical protein
MWLHVHIGDREAAVVDGLRLGVRDAAFDPAKHPKGGDPENAGRFSKGSGGGGKKAPAPKPTTTSPSPVTLKPSKERAWSGQPRPEATRLGKQEAGKLGEAIAQSYVRSLGAKDARPVNAKQSNFPVDLMGGDAVYEVKTGQVSNSRGATQWRATIGQPGPTETALLANMGPEEKRAWNERKERAIMARKAEALKQIAAETGRNIQAKTLTMILDPDRGIADVFEFRGFHKRIAYNSAEAEEGYVASFSYIERRGGGDEAGTICSDCLGSLGGIREVPGRVVRRLSGWATGPLW